MATHPPQQQARPEPTAADFREMRNSAEFAQLRSSYRNFTFPMTVAFFAWFIVYVLAAVFAPGFMGTPVAGGFNIGLIFGILQFVSTFAITWIYIRYANQHIEPRAAAIRQELEG